MTIITAVEHLLRKKRQYLAQSASHLWLLQCAVDKVNFHLTLRSTTVLCPHIKCPPSCSNIHVRHGYYSSIVKFKTFIRQSQPQCFTVAVCGSH